MAELPFFPRPGAGGVFSGPGTDPGYTKVPPVFSPAPLPPAGPVEPIGMPFYGGPAGTPKPNPTPMPFYGPTPGDSLSGVPRQGPSLPLPFFGPTPGDSLGRIYRGDQFSGGRGSVGLPFFGGGGFQPRRPISRRGPVDRTMSDTINAILTAYLGR